MEVSVRKLTALRLGIPLWHALKLQQQQFISVFPYKYMVLPTKVLEKTNIYSKYKQIYRINHITRDYRKSIHK